MQFQNCHNETQISRHVAAYYHMRAPPLQQRHSSFLLTARDPLERLASWYIFRHPENAHYFDVSPTQNVNLQQLYACYPTLEALVTQGLAHPRVTNKCASLAQDIVSGTMQPTRHADHMGWNYEFYLANILAEPQKQNHNDIVLFVIRTEFLWDDWNALERLLGGNATTNNNNAVSHKRHEASPLPVHNKTMSPRGMANLCCTLRQEIAIYAQALWRAVNLNAWQVQESLSHVEQKCGTLVSLERKCRGKR